MNIKIVNNLERIYYRRKLHSLFYDINANYTDISKPGLGSIGDKYYIYIQRNIMIEKF